MPTQYSTTDSRYLHARKTYPAFNRFFYIQKASNGNKGAIRWALRGKHGPLHDIPIQYLLRAVQKGTKYWRIPYDDKAEFTYKLLGIPCARVWGTITWKDNATTSIFRGPQKNDPTTRYTGHLLYVQPDPWQLEALDNIIIGRENRKFWKGIATRAGFKDRINKPGHKGRPKDWFGGPNRGTSSAWTQKLYDPNAVRVGEPLYPGGPLRV